MDNKAPEPDRNATILSTKQADLVTETTQSDSEQAEDATTNLDSFHAGRGQGRDVTWRDIHVTMPIKTKRSAKIVQRIPLLTSVTAISSGAGLNERTILRDVYGSAKAGEIFAIMGSSGAGKTTLLNVLCNTNQNKIKKMPSCEVLVNGEVLTQQQMRMASAYVQQVDMFVGNLTVFEQLTYSAELRMERSKYSAEDRKERVNHMLESLNLVKCRDTIIGVRAIRKGISVGEKKRLAFACELLTDPDILFCDEPTSGLDSFMAAQVVHCLKRLATQEMKCIIMTIHQPTDDVFQLFDKICFLSREAGEGRVAFIGTPDEVVVFFRHIAYSFELEKRTLGIVKKYALLEDMEGEELVVPWNQGAAEHAIRVLSKTVADTPESFEHRVKFIREEYEKTKAGQKFINRSRKSSEYSG